MQTLRAGYIKSADVGIITTSEEQKQKFKNEITFQAKKYPQFFGLSLEESNRVTKHSILVDVETIDRAHFLEKDLIIFSSVRSNKTNGLGNLKDPRRLNSLLWSG